MSNKVNTPCEKCGVKHDDHTTAKAGHHWIEDPKERRKAIKEEATQLAGWWRLRSGMYRSIGDDIELVRVRSLPSHKLQAIIQASYQIFDTAMWAQGELIRRKNQRRKEARLHQMQLAKWEAEERREEIEKTYFNIRAINKELRAANMPRAERIPIMHEHLALIGKPSGHEQAA